MIYWENINLSKDEYELINKISDRAMKYYPDGNKIKFDMDIQAVHGVGLKLDLRGLLNANEADFRHDISGINNNLNRVTGELENCFLPRYTIAEISLIKMYDEYIMRILRQRIGLDENDISRDKKINIYTPNEVFKEVLEWEGIGHYYMIKSWISDIYGVDLDEIKGKNFSNDKAAKENMQKCASALDETVEKYRTPGEMAGTSHYDMKEALNSLNAMYGQETVKGVLAAIVKERDWDGRFSQDNKEWAKGIDMVDYDIIKYCKVNAHPVVLNGLIEKARKMGETPETNSGIQTNEQAEAMKVSNAVVTAINNSAEFREHYEETNKLIGTNNSSPSMMFSIGPEAFYYGYDGAEIQCGRHTANRSAELIEQGRTLVIQQGPDERGIVNSDNKGNKLAGKVGSAQNFNPPDGKLMEKLEKLNKEKNVNGSCLGL